MINKLVFFSLSFLIGLSGWLQSSFLIAQPPQISGYQIAWYDEFDGNSLDFSKWNPQFSTNPTNNSLHAYLPENVEVFGGNMVIRSDNIGFGGLPYRSGQVISNIATRHGRVEVRGNLPTSTGMWPAIWLLPDAAWPSQGEIDIMENRGNQPLLTSNAFHWGTNPPFQHSFVYNEVVMTKNGAPVNFHDSFHTYAAEWDPDQVRFYVDGAHIYTVRDQEVQNFLTTAQTSPMRLIINTAIGGNFLPNPDGSTQWPQTFEVDYAYVYNLVGDRELDVENSDFETNFGSLSDWSLFGSNGQNVSSDNAQANSGFDSLKLFGQFNGNTNFSGIEQGATVQGGDEIRVQASAFIDSGDSIAGTENAVLLKFDYYSRQYGQFGSPDYISSTEIVLADGTTPNNQWINKELFDIAPGNAVEARVAVVFRQVDDAGGAVFVDDVIFENLNTMEVLPVESFSLNNGKVQNGLLDDLTESDNNYLNVLSSPATNNDSPLVLVVQSDSNSAESIDVLRFDVELAANTANLQVEVQALNFETGQFDTVAIKSLQTTDTTLEIDVPGKVGAYFGSSGKALFQLNVSANGPTMFFPWSLRFDNIQWVINP